MAATARPLAPWACLLIFLLQGSVANLDFQGRQALLLEGVPPEAEEQSEDVLNKALLEVAGTAENATTAALVEELLSKGADPEACCTKFGGRALHAAASSDNAAAAEALIAAGAEVNSRNEGFNDTPLHNAAVVDAARSDAGLGQIRWLLRGRGALHPRGDGGHGCTD
eukprot:evm.model.scf_1452.1 EVM.evm.TU.scf_1452.1   scf_1452:11814-14046(+)